MYGDVSRGVVSLVGPELDEERDSQIRHRRPLWEQLAMNRYQPGEGLKAHTDLLRFQDGICIVSLGSSAVLCFSEPVSALVHKVRRARLPAQSLSWDCILGFARSGAASVACRSTEPWRPTLQVFMAAGDLIMMHGPARYDWQHGIPSVAVDTLADGSQKARAERTSITFRAMDATAC